MLPNKKLILGHLYLKAFSLAKIPMLAFVSPSLAAWDEEQTVIKIPLSWRTKNHLGCMYFAALAAGADLAAGFAAMSEIRASGAKVSLIFKDLQANFLKRAEGDVLFTCREGAAIKALVEKALTSGERVELPIPVVATVPAKLGDDPVATFTLTLSLKRSKEKSA
jgi:acyl-coenzyme A thioesterase PaaI-like protein